MSRHSLGATLAGTCHAGPAARRATVAEPGESRRGRQRKAGGGGLRPGLRRRLLPLRELPQPARSREASRRRGDARHWSLRAAARPPRRPAGRPGRRSRAAWRPRCTAPRARWPPAPARQRSPRAGRTPVLPMRSGRAKESRPSTQVAPRLHAAVHRQSAGPDQVAARSVDARVRRERLAVALSPPAAPAQATAWEDAARAGAGPGWWRARTARRARAPPARPRSCGG